MAERATPTRGPASPRGLRPARRGRLDVGRSQGHLLVPLHRLHARLHPQPRLLLHGQQHGPGRLQLRCRSSTGAPPPTRTCPARRRPGRRCPGRPARRSLPCRPRARAPRSSSRARTSTSSAAAWTERPRPRSWSPQAMTDEGGSLTGNLAPWREGPALPEPRADAALGIYVGIPYLVGGVDASGDATDTVYKGIVEDGELVGWELADGADGTDELTLPQPLSGAAVVPGTSGFVLLGGRGADGAAHERRARCMGRGGQHQRTAPGLAAARGIGPAGAACGCPGGGRGRLHLPRRRRGSRGRHGQRLPTRAGRSGAGHERARRAARMGGRACRGGAARGPNGRHRVPRRRSDLRHRRLRCRGRPSGEQLLGGTRHDDG